MNLQSSRSLVDEDVVTRPWSVIPYLHIPSPDLLSSCRGGGIASLSRSLSLLNSLRDTCFDSLYRCNRQS